MFLLIYCHGKIIFPILENLRPVMPVKQLTKNILHGKYEKLQIHKIPFFSYHLKIINGNGKNKKGLVKANGKGQLCQLLQIFLHKGF